LIQELLSSTFESWMKSCKNKDRFKNVGTLNHWEKLEEEKKE